MHKNNAVNLKINKIILVQRQISFVVALLLMFSGKTFGQKTFIITSSPMASISTGYYHQMSYASACKNNPFLTIEKGSVIAPIISLKIISPLLYSSNLGFICKKELQLDKVVAIPLRFRLGSLAYVNYLEQKPNAINPLR